MSIQPQPSAPAVQGRTFCTPLLDLIRTALVERGAVTLRVMPDPGDELVVLAPDEDTLFLADDQDDVRFLTSLVYGLHLLGLGDADPRLEDAVTRFVQDATRRTLAGMGEVAR